MVLKPNSRMGYPAWWIVPLLLLMVASGSAVMAAANDLVLTASTDILVVNGAQQRVVAQVPMGRFVKDMIVLPGGRFACAAHSGGVEIIDLTTFSVVGHPLRHPTRWLAASPDGNRLYALTYGTPEMKADGDAPAGYFLDTVDLTQTPARRVSHLELGAGVFHMSVSTATGSVFLLDLGARTLMVRELADGRVRRAISLPDWPGGEQGPNGVFFRMALGHDGRRVYIPEMRQASGIWEVDTFTGLSKWIPLGFESYPRGLAVSPDGALLHVMALDALYTLDLKSREVTAFRECQLVHQGLGVSSDGNRLYSAVPTFKTGGALDTFDATTLERLGRVPLPDHSPFTVATGR